MERKPSQPLEDARSRRERLHTVLVRVERALASPAGAREADWMDALRREVAELQQAFEDHIVVTEGQAGLFEEVIAQAPRLAHAVDVLRAEHGEIGSQLADILDWLSRPPTQREPDATDQARDRVMGLLGYLARHRQKGADLIYEAYEVDVGGLE